MTHSSHVHCPLTIVQVASNLASWGGLEIHLLNLAVQLQERGHRVIIAGQPERFVLSRARALGLETFEATVRRQSDWTDFGRYRDFLRREKVDIIHAHTKDDALVPAAAARLAGVPVSVVTWHLPFPFRSRLGGNLILALLHRRMIAISGSVRDRHIENGVPARRIEVIYHGTDTEAFRAVTIEADAMRGLLGLAPGDIAVGIVGRVAPEKGHRDLLEALRLMAVRYPHLRAVIIGDGPDEPYLRQKAREKGIFEKTIFTGFREDVKNLINALDIVVVPSVWHEPCSAVIQQAMALSKPVIGSRMGGTPEMVQDGVNGLLIPASDPYALAAALARLADEPDLRRRMGGAGKVCAEEKFTLRRMTDEVESLYLREYQKVRGIQATPRAEKSPCKKV